MIFHRLRPTWWWFFKFIYFGLHWVFTAACGLRLAAVSGGHSLLRCSGGAQALGTQASATVVHGLRALAQQLRRQGSRCSKGCGLFLDQGLDLCSLYWQADSYLLYHQGSPLLAFYQQFWLLLRH